MCPDVNGALRLLRLTKKTGMRRGPKRQLPLREYEYYPILS